MYLSAYWMLFLFVWRIWKIFKFVFINKLCEIQLWIQTIWYETKVASILWNRAVLGNFRSSASL